MSMRVAFIGLGVMGFPMAGHLARAGHDVTVYNRTTARAEAWVAQHGGRRAESPALAAAGCEFVMTCVGNDDDVRAVVLGAQGALAGMDRGAVLVDHTTASAGLARELAQACGERGCGFVDAPVSGGQAGAENGALSIMCGGEPEPFERVRNAVAPYTRMIRHLGPAGCGQLTKMVNQICAAGLLQGLSEGIHFAEQAGLDVGAVMQVIAGGAAQSWQLENRHRTMHERQFDFGFAIDWMRKDLGMVLEEATRNGAQLPVTELVDRFYGEVQAAGGGRWDTSALITRLGAGRPKS